MCKVETSIKVFDTCNNSAISNVYTVWIDRDRKLGYETEFCNFVKLHMF